MTTSVRISKRGLPKKIPGMIDSWANPELTKSQILPTVHRDLPRPTTTLPRSKFLTPQTLCLGSRSHPTSQSFLITTHQIPEKLFFILNFCFYLVETTACSQRDFKMPKHLSEKLLKYFAIKKNFPTSFCLGRPCWNPPTPLIRRNLSKNTTSSSSLRQISSPNARPRG